MSAREAVIEMIQRLPDSVSAADIMDELYFRLRVEEGLRQLDAGEGVPHGQVEQRVRPWQH